mgnify:CR=1 FL=1
MAIPKDLDHIKEIWRELDLCPSCKTQLTLMTKEKDLVIRRCSTCKMIVQDTIKKRLPNEKN